MMVTSQPTSITITAKYIKLPSSFSAVVSFYPGAGGILVSEMTSMVNNCDDKYIFFGFAEKLAALIPD